jgi:hypothetical protein
MLACGTRILGVKEYNCDKPECPHVRYVTNSCGSRACPSCGKRPTDLWIATQLNRLPDCDWVNHGSPAAANRGVAEYELSE